MTNAELEMMYQFLAGYWYDREENDAAIIDEFIHDVGEQDAFTYIKLIKQFINSPDAANFIRKAVWRYFSAEDDAPITWLKDVLLLLEQAIDQSSKKNTRHD